MKSRFLDWNPSKGLHQPFILLKNKNGLIRYREKLVCQYLGKYYTIQNWYWDYHRDGNNEAKLMPVTTKCLDWLVKQQVCLQQSA